MKVLGIDPGLKGALCLLNAPERRIISLIPMPTIPYRKKLSLDIESMVGWMLEHGGCDFVSTEFVHSMPGQGVVSMFSFGRGVGMLQGAFKVLNVPVMETPPSVWKATIGVTADKATSIEMAVRLFPKQAALFEGRRADFAESALLAVFGGLYYRKDRSAERSAKG
jgi:crossover junction endodeoxyribonuclease RuvC